MGGNRSIDGRECVIGWAGGSVDGRGVGHWMGGSVSIDGRECVNRWVGVGR